MNRIEILKSEVLDVLENNILRFWLDKMQDKENGGFYGQMTGEGELVKTADKGGILNARILWSFSAAYRVLRKPEYLEAATRAKEYIIEHLKTNNEFSKKIYKYLILDDSVSGTDLCIILWEQDVRFLSEHREKILTHSSMLHASMAEELRRDAFLRASLRNARLDNK